MLQDGKARADAVRGIDQIKILYQVKKDSGDSSPCPFFIPAVPRCLIQPYTKPRLAGCVQENSHLPEGQISSPEAISPRKTGFHLPEGQTSSPEAISPRKAGFHLPERQISSPEAISPREAGFHLPKGQISLKAADEIAFGGEIFAALR